MDFWNSILTGKSWEILKELCQKPFHFILIGGWAAYLWTDLHKSKDIDIILPEFRDLEYLKKHYALKKNDALKKYEIQFEEIDIDIYVPYYSRLALPIEEIIRHTARRENITVVQPEILLILKQGAEADREHSTKGLKDRVDIMALLCSADINFKKYHGLLRKHALKHFSSRLQKIISDFTEIKYLELNPRQFKLKKKELLGKLRDTAVY